MVSLARALMAGPRLLLVDELSIGLAPLVTRDLLAVVRRITELGTTVIIVEQSVVERAVGRRHGDVHGQGRASCPSATPPTSATARC